MRGRYIALAFVLAAALMLAAAGCSGGSGVSASAGGEISGVEGGTKPNTDVGALQPEENELREEGLEPEAPQSGLPRKLLLLRTRSPLRSRRKRLPAKAGPPGSRQATDTIFMSLSLQTGNLWQAGSTVTRAKAAGEETPATASKTAGSTE